MSSHLQNPKSPGSDASKRLIVSIHDVTQHNCVEVAKILIDLEKIGVSKTSLLVIPDHHSRGVISSDPDAGPWLHSLVRRGHEIVLHGYYHKRERRIGESLRDRIITRFYTADEGEFYDISQFEAERRLQDARRVLREMALSASGFIAPAWLLGEGGEKACRALGFQFTVRFDSIVDLANGQKTMARTLVYSTRSAWRRAASMAFNPWLARKCLNHPVLRISIHPPDREYPRLWAQILNLTRQALAGREAVTYIEQVMDSRRRASAQPHHQAA